MPPNSSMNEYIVMQYVLKYYAAMKINKLHLHLTWVNLRPRFWEKEARHNIYYIVPFVYISKMDKNWYVEE